jgi:hypothetical protein
MCQAGAAVQQFSNLSSRRDQTQRTVPDFADTENLSSPDDHHGVAGHLEMVAMQAL